ncbi:MAG TPA: DUF1080 domain-containing protein [Candidatus Didemnitutus sp.]|nr:DUF1080 domain-containing protein [Candidatus Didemnitutus sp.]
MKIPALLTLSLTAFAATCVRAEPDPNWIDHDRERPMATPIDPGTASTQDQPGRPPSDATVLFDGKDISQWVAMDGSPTKWIIHDGAFECVPGSGYARTLQSFGDCQLHVEWTAPNPPHGESQDRGNSGVFLGYDRYEIQVLDSYQAKTYADGAAGSVYGQYPPLVNATRPPGQWQVYDIVWTAPRFDAEGKLISKARETVFHNGVLIQNNVELTGPTGWINRIPYKAHPERLPIAFQDHGHPVRYRNVWVRELGHPRHKEFMLADATLDGFVGSYGTGQWNSVKVRRLADGLLSLTLSGQELVLHAESPTKFFAFSTDVQCEFDSSSPAKHLTVSVGDSDHAMKLERVGP